MVPIILYGLHDHLNIAGRDAVLAAQVASAGTQVTIQAIEEAENKAQANGQALHEFLENRTIADLVAEAPPGLLAIEDIKPDEYYQASDQIRDALQDLPEQIQQREESRLANWLHTTENYPDNLWMDCEYAKNLHEDWRSN